LVKIRIAIVVAEFNSSITFQMLKTAENEARKLKAEIKYVCYVPGSFDMPLIVDELLKKEDVDAVVTLGAVIKGETHHDCIVVENAARLIADLSLRHRKPVSLGITGPGMTVKQAKERAKGVPLRAVNAAITMATRVKKIKNGRYAPRRKVIIIN
jgi:6,7-dimethyl-8-ribityllumazine synthase